MLFRIWYHDIDTEELFLSEASAHAHSEKNSQGHIAPVISAVYYGGYFDMAFDQGKISEPLYCFGHSVSIREITYEG